MPAISLKPSLPSVHPILATSLRFCRYYRQPTASNILWREVPSSWVNVREACITVTVSITSLDDVCCINQCCLGFPEQ